jgi:hypothetical protein
MGLTEKGLAFIAQMGQPIEKTLSESALSWQARRDIKGRWLDLGVLFHVWALVNYCLHVRGITRKPGLVAFGKYALRETWMTTRREIILAFCRHVCGSGPKNGTLEMAIFACGLSGKLYHAQQATICD